MYADHFEADQTTGQENLSEHYDRPKELQRSLALHTDKQCATNNEQKSTTFVEIPKQIEPI